MTTTPTVMNVRLLLTLCRNAICHWDFEFSREDINPELRLQLASFGSYYGRVSIFYLFRNKHSDRIIRHIVTV
jgi:hypothetical protein